jgi:hypothetical protein
VFLLLDRAKQPKMVSMASRLLHRVARNDQVDWSEFDAQAYCADNYRELRDDDHEFITRVSDFFAAATGGSCADSLGAGGAVRRAVDVGTGSNLYPALAMLPFCTSLELREYSTSNIAWLHGQKDRGFDPSWDVFWDAYRDNVAYKEYSDEHDVRAEFSAKTSIERGNVFQLPRAQWDLGTMFFVACSLSARHAEFRRAVARFVGSLKPGAPFAAAFMTNSAGYLVGDSWFPAVSVDIPEIRKSLASIARDVDVRPIDSHVPVRRGVGMALATGHAC